jgi:hypothetical protein
VNLHGLVVSSDLSPVHIASRGKVELGMPPGMRLSQPAVGFINDCGKWDEEQSGTFAFSLLHFVAENWVNRYSWAAISSED